MCISSTENGVIVEGGVSGMLEGEGEGAPDVE